MWRRVSARRINGSGKKKLKLAGLWGTKRKEATLWKSGSSVLLRIPKDIAETLNLKADEKVVIYPEGKKDW